MSCPTVLRLWRHVRSLGINFALLLIRHPCALFEVQVECVRPCDQKSYLHNETKGGICIKIDFYAKKNISLLQHGRCFFVYSSNMAAVTSCEHTIITSTESITRNSVKYLFRVIRRVMWEAMVIPETAEGKEIRYRIVLLKDLCYSVDIRTVSRQFERNPSRGKLLCEINGNKN